MVSDLGIITVGQLLDILNEQDGSVQKCIDHILLKSSSYHGRNRDTFARRIYYYKKFVLGHSRKGKKVPVKKTGYYNDKRSTDEIRADLFTVDMPKKRPNESNDMERP